MQNIPAHEKTIRMIFKAAEYEETITCFDDKYTVKKWTEVETTQGFKYADRLTLDDNLIIDDNIITPIKQLYIQNNNIIIEI